MRHSGYLLWRIYKMKTLFFYVLHKNYNPLGGLVNSVIGCFATMEKPSIRILYCWGVISRASDVFQGPLYAPTSSLLYKRRNPSPSQSSPLIRLFFFPQNRNRVSLLIPWFANHSFVLRPECWQSRIIPAQYCSFAWSISSTQNICLLLGNSQNSSRKTRILLQIFYDGWMLILKVLTMERLLLYFSQIIFLNSFLYLRFFHE